MQDLNAPPINPLPAIVWALALPMIAMEVVLSAGANGLAGGPMAVGWRSQAIQMFAFSPDYLRRMLQVGVYPADGLWRPFTYGFVQPNVTQALFVVVFVLALGKYVSEAFRWWAVAIVFFASSLGAALAYTAIPYTQAALVGGYPPVYGLIGAFTYVNWMKMEGAGPQRLRAFRLIGFLMGIRLLVGVISLTAYGVNQGASLDWTAELFGFLTGFLLSFAVSPGGWRRVLTRIRTR